MKNGSQAPPRTRLDFSACRQNARVRAVFPIPASPATTMSLPAPAFASEWAPCSAASTSSRSSRRFAVARVLLTVLTTKIRVPQAGGASMYPPEQGLGRDGA